jgi:RNA polymerase sigma-70 factor (ECF subfamily)
MDEETNSALESLHCDAFGWALHCCGGDHGKAEDVLQSAYTRFYAGKVRRSGISSFKTWWFGIIRICAMEARRKQLFHELFHLRWGAEFHDRKETVSPDSAMAYSEVALRLRAALATLPSRQAEILHLVFYQDLTLADAARAMSVSVGSARQHYDRAKARLRELLQCES